MANHLVNNPIPLAKHTADPGHHSTYRAVYVGPAGHGPSILALSAINGRLLELERNLGLYKKTNERVVVLERSLESYDTLGDRVDALEAHKTQEIPDHSNEHNELKRKMDALRSNLIANQQLMYDVLDGQKHARVAAAEAAGAAWEFPNDSATSK